MKLKKIASLMLAGVMAVSMLAACDGKGDSNSTNDGNITVTPASSYTATILEKTAATTKTLLQGGSNSKLDKAVAYAAANAVYENVKDELTSCNANGSFVVAAAEYMGDAEYTDLSIANDENDTFWKLVGDKDVTVYTLLSVKRMYNDEYINNRVAEVVDEIASVLDINTKDSNDTYEYTVNIAKADCVYGNEADRTDDSVIVGIAITLDYTADKF